MENECKCADKASPFESYHCQICDADWLIDTNMIDDLIRDAVNAQCPDTHNFLIGLGPEVQEYLETVVEYCADCGLMVYSGDLIYSDYQQDRICDQCWEEDNHEMDM